MGITQSLRVKFSSSSSHHGKGHEGHEKEGGHEGHEGDEEEGSDEGHEGDEEEGSNEGHEGDEGYNDKGAMKANEVVNGRQSLRSAASALNCTSKTMDAFVHTHCRYLLR